MDPDRLERVWYGDAIADRATRGLLAPLSWTFAAISGFRNALYDRHVLRAHALALPALSVGNLTAGGTGKTPIAADITHRLAERGARPAVVLRGFGDDEPAVHARLTPTAIVVVDADRVAGATEARARGADVVVLDDAFQHRRAARLVDVVLVNADRWDRDPRRALPAGPWREPLRGLRRADLVIVTHKLGVAHAVAASVAACRDASPAPVAVARLAPADLVALRTGERHPVAELAGASVLAVAGIGEPGAFFAQLRACGAIVQARAYRDHHRFTATDAEALALAAEAHDLVVCTLKDAVKLEPLWPRASGPLWYVSQSVSFEAGESHLVQVIDRLLAARHPTHSN